MIIDSHVHVYDPDSYQDEIIFTLADGTNFKPGIKVESASPKALIADMDKNKVNKAVIQSLSTKNNEFISDLFKKHPDRFHGFAWVDNPKDTESVSQLEAAVKHQGLSGLKLHPDLQGFAASDIEIVPLIEKTVELDVPVLIHQMQGFPGYYYNNLAWHLDILNHRVPEARIIIGHMYGYRFTDLATLMDRPNLYAESSWGLTFIADLFGLDFLNRFIKKIGAGKLLFGSDWVGSHGEMERQLDIINRLELNRDEREKILGGNILALIENKNRI